MVVGSECVVRDWSAVLCRSEHDLRCQGARSGHLRPGPLTKTPVMSEVEQSAMRVGLEVPVRSGTSHQVRHGTEIGRDTFLIGSATSDVCLGATDDYYVARSHRHSRTERVHGNVVLRSRQVTSDDLRGLVMRAVNHVAIDSNNQVIPELQGLFDYPPIVDPTIPELGLFAAWHIPAAVI